MSKYFKYCKSVFIGKSFLKKFEHSGGQNPIEAAVLGCKIYHGPYINNFKEVYEFLFNMKISKQINDFKDLSLNLIDDFNNPQKAQR